MKEEKWEMGSVGIEEWEHGWQSERVPTKVSKAEKEKKKMMK